ncbi:MAG: bifunctional riboflavin kinase/FAD synthetase [Gammaproteobacteria bacterium]|nr:bifunctional riboflavin kinase/FAD synthetase [Gammaproteobacteria bacterium]
MKIIRSINAPILCKKGCVLTIGNFDAVHVGHQKILQQLVIQGKKLELPVVVMTFDPTPQEYFQRDNAAARLTTIGSRFFQLRECGVDIMLALKFDQLIAQTSADDFIEDYLFNTLNVKYLLVGDDFRFGAGRKGNYDLLVNASEKFNFQLGRFDTVIHQDSGDEDQERRRVSSTYVRELLREGDMQEASKLLGRNYSMVGRVLHGDKRGRQWGFPTLNLAVTRTPPMMGVYAVRVIGIESGALSGVANLGRRPTVDGLKMLLEVHLFDFSKEIYGKRVCVEFMSKIRDEQKFDSFDALKVQIAKDSQTARMLAKNWGLLVNANNFRGGM